LSGNWERLGTAAIVVIDGETASGGQKGCATTFLIVDVVGSVATALILGRIIASSNVLGTRGTADSSDRRESSGTAA